MVSFCGNKRDPPYFPANGLGQKKCHEREGIPAEMSPYVLEGLENVKPPQLLKYKLRRKKGKLK
jgi:hypothetical protein